MADAPHDIQSNLRLWLDGLDVSATDTGNGGGTNPSNGAQVTTWKDKSANAYIMGNATDYGSGAHTYPTYTAGIGVLFNGISNVMEIPSGIYGNNITVNNSDIFISTNSSYYADNLLYYIGGVSVTNNRMNILLPYSNNLIGWVTGSSSSVSSMNATFSGSYGQIYLYNFGSTQNGPQTIMRDGSILATQTNTANYTQLSSDRVFLGGCCAGIYSNYYHGTVSEFIVYSRRLNAAERNIIQSYLAAKYANPGGAGTANRYTNAAGYGYHVGGIGQESDGSLTTGTSAGLTIANTSFLATGNYVLAGLPALSPSTGSTATETPTGYKSRSKRIWYLNRTGTGTGAISLSFKLADLGVTATNGQRLALLSRSATTGTFTTLTTANYTGSGTASFSISNPQSGYYALALEPVPVVTASLTNSVQSDGINSSNFKAIPNALIKASANMTNSGPGSPDSNSTTLTIPVPANTTFYVGDIGVTGAGPVTFNQGSPTSGLTYTYTALGSSSDGLEFSNDSGATWTYSPVPDAQQGDANITHVRINPTGSFATSTALTGPH